MSGTLAYSFVRGGDECIIETILYTANLARTGGAKDSGRREFCIIWLFMGASLRYSTIRHVRTHTSFRTYSQPHADTVNVQESVKEAADCIMLIADPILGDASASVPNATTHPRGVHALTTMKSIVDDICAFVGWAFSHQYLHCYSCLLMSITSSAVPMLDRGKKQDNTITA